MENKFKVWSKRLRAWVYPVIDVTNDFDGFKDDSRIFMQYIGLDDNNDNGIYADCHIVKFKYMEELDKIIDMIGVFHYSDEELRYEIEIFNQGDEYVCLSYQYNGAMYDFEIIGNIHEHKHLLPQPTNN